MNQFIIEDIPIDIIQKDVKNIYLVVSPPHGKVKISKPIKSSIESVKLFALSKLEWIKKQRKLILSQEAPFDYKYVSGEYYYYLGKKYKLNVVFRKGRSKVLLQGDNNVILYVSKDSNLEIRQKIITKWYRQMLNEKLPCLIDKWQKVVGVEIADWRIKQMKTKWGTCNIRKKRIWLNLELIKKPENCLEYIIVHELVHLLESKHNKRFKAYMDKFMPQWRMYKKELDHGNQNLSYD